MSAGHLFTPLPGTINFLLIPISIARFTPVGGRGGGGAVAVVVVTVTVAVVVVVVTVAGRGGRRPVVKIVGIR